MTAAAGKEALPRTPSFRLDGKRALVTGASSGIGLGAAVALADAGARVLGVARGERRLADAVQDMKAASLDVEGKPLDIADLDATCALMADEGPFDIVVNAAGVARHSPALDTTAEDFDAVMATNWRATHFLAREAARGMIAAGKSGEGQDPGRPLGGSIILISSQMGKVGGPNRSVYCGTKHAVEGMVKAMAMEWGGHGVRINSICPTFVRTPLAEPMLADPAFRDWVLSKIKLPRVAEVSDIMGAVVFLASEASAMVTGGALMVDGGWTAG